MIKTIFGFIVLTDVERIISDPDSIGYYRLAENLRHHGIFSRSESPPFLPDNVITPVYPFFLATLLSLAGGSLWIIPLAQGLINSLTAVFTLKTGERLFGQRAGLIAGICYALDPSALVHTFSLLTESLFAFLFLAANFFLVKYIQRSSLKNLILSALLLGLATLCRPVALYYFLVVAVILFVTRRPMLVAGIKNVVLYIFIFMLALGPWLIRNKLTFGIANLTSIQGNNLLLINAAHLKAAQEHLDYATAECLLEAEADSLLVARGLTAEKLKLEYHGRQYGYQINDPRQARVYEKLAIEKIMASPLLYIRVHLTGIIPSLFDASVREIYHFRGKERPLLGLRSLFVTGEIKSAVKKLGAQMEAGYLMLHLGHVGWLMMHYIFLALTICRLIKEKTAAPLWLLLLPFLYLLLITAPAGSERFRFPAMPCLYVLSAAAISRLRWPALIFPSK
ncbi:MAG: glycosyltransferase family 39 protein [candidate division KSB1 bacterium]|nr:glycosyltransferase family 39 protein [candidate division KSB1 bacterium]MDZ7366242.1 glycosyltransferase family 39 protein [candidate division KSB1 bacterium]